MLSWEDDVEAHALRRQGWSISAIARHLGHDRKTIRAYLRGDRAPGRRAARGPEVMAPFVEYCRIRLADDPHLWASALLDELRELGYDGSYPSLTAVIRRDGLRPHCEPCQASRGRDVAVIGHPPGEEPQFGWLELPGPPPGWGRSSHAHLLAGALSCPGRWRAVLAEAEDFAHLAGALDQVARKLGGLTRRWRSDRMAAVCDPGSGKLTAAFAGLAKYYEVAVDICPPRHGNRKGVVDKASHSAAQRWWRTLGDDVTVAAAQAGIDALAARLDGRRRPRDGQRVSVGELAAGEPLRPVPGVPFPAEITAARIVSPQALVAYRGNSYSVPPGIGGTTVTVTHRLGSDQLVIAAASGTVIARHRRAPDGAGLSVREPGHVRALDKAVLAAFTPAAPCKRKERRPPSPAALAEAGRLRGTPAPPTGSSSTWPPMQPQPAGCRTTPAPTPRRNNDPARHERGTPLPAAPRPPVLPQAHPGRRGAAPHPGRGQGRAAVPDRRPGTAARNRGHRHRGTPPDLPAAVRLPARALDPGRLRLLRPARRRREAHPRPGHAAVPRRRLQRAARRPARRRQDHARHRPGPRCRRGRPPGLPHHRRRPGRPLPQSRPGRPLEHRHAVLRRPPPARHRRARLPPPARRRLLRPVPGHQPALPALQHHLDHQRRHRRLGRRLRRRHRRRRHARPAPAPRRRRRHRRALLPAPPPPGHRRHLAPGSQRPCLLQTRTCPVCWTEFTTTQRRRIYCSRKCCGTAWERRGGRRTPQARPAAPAAPAAPASRPPAPASPQPAATRDCPHCGQPVTIVALLTTPQAAQPRIPQPATSTPPLRLA